MQTAYSENPPATPSAPAGMQETAPGDTPEGEKELVRKLAAEFLQDEKRENPLVCDFDKWRDYLRGKTHGGNFTVNVNLCQSTMGVLVPKLYARNPDVSVTPADSVDAGRFEAVRQFGRTAEVMCSREWRRGRLKGKLKRQVRGTLTIGFAWLKAAMQIDTVTDPVMQSRINDLQDNLAEIDRKVRVLQEGGHECYNEEAMREELVIEMQAAQAKLEVERARGMVFVNPRAEDILVSGEIRELVDYPDAERITHRTWWKADSVCATFQVSKDQLRTATRYRLTGDSSAPKSVTEDAEGDWLAVLERWDRKAGVVHTFVNGCEFLLRPSGPPNPSSSRFYPFFLSAWNWVDDTRLPLSDVAQWAPLQDEYNSVRSNFKEHRRRSMPSRVVNGQVVNDADATKMKDTSINEIVRLVGVDPAVPIGNLVAELRGASIDPALYDVRPIMYDLDLVSGVQEAARQAIKTDITATEANIQEASGAGRTTERQDTLEDMLAEVAQYTIELMLQVYTEEDAIRIAGVGAVWPGVGSPNQLSIDELHNIVEIEIRAGTTSKPSTVQGQKVWGTLLPIIQPMVERIHVLRQQAQGGQVITDPKTGMQMQMPPDPSAAMLADCLQELLIETVKRTDDRIDVTKFLPPDPKRQMMQPPIANQQPQPAAPAAPSAAPAAIPA